VAMSWHAENAVFSESVEGIFGHGLVHFRLKPPPLEQSGNRRDEEADPSQPNKVAFVRLANRVFQPVKKSRENPETLKGAIPLYGV
jgi:hypothetical protein